MIGIIHSQFDIDSLNFLNATGITNSTQRLAINYLVTYLKLNNLWDKFYALYPFVGGTLAVNHKFNLKDPRDLDAAFRINFAAATVFSNNGVGLGGSITQYGDTKFIPSVQCNSTDLLSLGYYSRTAAAAPTAVNTASYDIGSSSTAGAAALLIRRQLSNSCQGAIDTSTSTYRTAASSTTDGSGLFTLSQEGTSISLYRNTTTLATNTTVSASLNFSTQSIYLGCLNNNGAAVSATFLGPRTCALSFIAKKLTSGQVSTLYTIIQQYQTILSRQV